MNKLDFERKCRRDELAEAYLSDDPHELRFATARCIRNNDLGSGETVQSIVADYNKRLNRLVYTGQPMISSVDE